MNFQDHYINLLKSMIYDYTFKDHYINLLKSMIYDYTLCITRSFRHKKDHSKILQMIFALQKMCPQKYYMSNINVQDEDGYTLLMLAASHCDDPVIISSLLNAGAHEHINLQHRDNGLTAVAMAAKSNHLEIVKLLILYGAKIYPEHREYFPKPDINKDIVYARMYHDVIRPSRRDLKEMNKIMLERSNFLSGTCYELSITFVAHFTFLTLLALVFVIADKILEPMAEFSPNQWQNFV